MSYDFNPLTDEQIDSINLMQEGIYNFEVVKSVRKISKSGNPMAELHLSVFDKEGRNHTVFDYLVFSNVPLNIKKIKQFCDTVKLQEEYKKGQLPEDLERFCGNVKIGIQDEQPNPNGGFYPRKNSVMEYVSGEIENSKIDSQEFKDDDISF